MWERRAFLRSVRRSARLAQFAVGPVCAGCADEHRLSGKADRRARLCLLEAYGELSPVDRVGWREPDSSTIAEERLPAAVDPVLSCAGCADQHAKRDPQRAFLRRLRR